jgi:hypothetical protein
MPGELSNVIAGRVANVFGLRGANFTTDAACASSLAALEAGLTPIVCVGETEAQYDAGQTEAVVSGQVSSGPPRPPRTIRMVGGELRHLNPDERTTASLFLRALGIPGLAMEEGFLAGLLGAPFEELEQPALAAVELALSAGSKNLLLFARSSSDLGKALAPKAPADPGLAGLISHQGHVRVFARPHQPPGACPRVRVTIELDTLRREPVDLANGFFSIGPPLVGVHYKRVVCK